MFRRRRVIPGFGLTLGVTLGSLGLVILVPLGTLFWRAAERGPWAILGLAAEPRVIAALGLSFGASLAAALINLVFGLLVAWVLVRYTFPGKRVVDAVVDLPFALPTAVAGITLATLYARSGWIGSLLGPDSWLGALFGPTGLAIAYTPLGVVVALTFIGLPFVVRLVEPVLREGDRAAEEAAASLGAGRLQTVLRVVLPGLMPALATGFALALARGLGEYGSVIFIAGNLPMVSEIAPLLIVTRLEEYDYAGASAIAVILLGLSFALLLVINLLQGWAARRNAQA